MSVRTNIVIDERLIREAKDLTDLKTKREIVDLALHELLKTLKRKRLLAIRRSGMWQGDLAKSRRGRSDSD